MSRREPMGSGECSTDSLNELCECGHQRRRHLEPPGAQCVACSGDEERSWRHDFKPKHPKPAVTPKNADHRCRCGHIKYAHQKSQGVCGVDFCKCMAFVCDHSRCGWKPREECQHPDKQFTGSLYDGPGGRKSWLYYTCPDCKAKWREEKPEQCDHPDNDPCDRCLPGEPEPPLTPEEEEQAPEDEHRCTCGETACESESCDCDSVPCPVDHAREAAEAAQEALEDDWKPPQPERRPPYLVGYSVAGHLYEVALPGDAVVQAVDGALVIKHRLGFVAGIAHVAPLVNEGGA
jgi:hypothetical protein